MRQMRLESYFKVDLQSTIVEFSDCKVRMWDEYVRLRSRDGKFTIQCNHFKRSFISGTESLVRCNYPGEDRKCSFCLLQRTKRIWVPVLTEWREEPRFVSNRRKFLGWRKE